MTATVTMVDTSVLCELLQVPGKCSPARGADVAAEVDRRWEAGERFVIPITSVIETGNHIAQADGNRYDVAARLVRLLRVAISEESHWRVLQTRLGAEFLEALWRVTPPARRSRLWPRRRWAPATWPSSWSATSSVPPPPFATCGSGRSTTTSPSGDGPAGPAVSAPPPYPRIPHLVGGRGTTDDLVLDAGAAAELLSHPVLVEEKVDGANVVLWVEDGRVEVALRAGPGAMDRAGQLGPLRAWASSNDQSLRELLGDGTTALHAEWLLLTHSSPYDRLPSYLVALDLWRPGPGLLAVDERDAVCAAAGLSLPPQVWTGVAGSVAAVERLLGPSAWGPAPAEGLVLRSLADPALRAKLVPAGFRRLDDDEWRRGRPRNQLAAQGASWH